MWKDAVEKRFFWAAMGQELEKLLYELIKAEEEEDDAIYLLMLHYDHAHREDPVAMKHKKEIMKKLSLLIQDTRRHQRLLQEMIERLEKGAKSHEYRACA